MVGPVPIFPTPPELEALCESLALAAQSAEVIPSDIKLVSVKNLHGIWSVFVLELLTEASARLEPCDDAIAGPVSTLCQWLAEPPAPWFLWTSLPKLFEELESKSDSAFNKFVLKACFWASTAAQRSATANKMYTEVNALLTSGALYHRDEPDFARKLSIHPEEMSREAAEALKQFIASAIDLQIFALTEADSGVGQCSHCCPQLRRQVASTLRERLLVLLR